MANPAAPSKATVCFLTAAIPAHTVPVLPIPLIPLPCTHHHVPPQLCRTRRELRQGTPSSKGGHRLGVAEALIFNMQIQL